MTRHNNPRIIIICTPPLKLMIKNAANTIIHIIKNIAINSSIVILSFTYGLIFLLQFIINY
jgi:hypothetical protein